MCLVGSPKAPQVQAPPAPAPTVTPSEVSPQGAQEARRKRLETVRAGLLSTIKTSPKGLTGNQADLQPPSLLGQKTKLGA